jgi:hypothetical protein
VLRKIPDKAGQFSSDGAAGPVLMDTACGEATIALAKTKLSSPGDLAQGSRKMLLADLHLSSDACRMAVTPGRLDQHTPRVSVASASDTALGATLAARALTRYQAKEGHQLLGVGEATQIPKLCDQSEGADEVSASEAHQRLDHGSQAG